MSSLQTLMLDCGLLQSAQEDGPFVPLLVTVFTSILEVFLLCLAGYILAGRGILDKKTQKQLNRLNVSLFTPSLLFSKVAFFLSPEKLKELWIIPIFFVIVTTVSMSVSFLLGSIFRVKRSQRNFAMAAAMFMNSNSLPIALMQSLVVTVPGLKWGKGDNKNAMVGRALTYLVLYSTLGMVLRWSYGVRLLAQSDPESEAGASADTVDETSPLLGEPVGFPADEGTLRPNSSAYDDPVPHISVQAPPPPPLLRPGHERRRSRFYNSFPNSPNQSRVQLPTVDSIPNSASQSTFAASPVGSEDSEDELLPGPTEPAPSALPQHVRPSTRHVRQGSTISQVGAGPAGHLRRTRRRLYRAWVALNEFMTVPLWAALASLVVACVQPLQHALDDHMQPIKGAVTSAGNCSIPLTLIVLGGYFYPAPPEGAAANGHANGNGVGNGHGNGAKHARRMSQSTHSLLESVREMFGKQKNSAPAGPFPGETKTVVIAVLSRMILTPLLLLPLMVVCARFDLHAVFDDPVFVVANVLLVSSPPALTLAQITQAASGDAFERLISRTTFWAYCVVTPPMTIVYVIIGLKLSKL
ncbi:membrane transport protein-domain-containing protein [Mycena albidolilacea]|uniref:Membrane transport protein-domain-containing protein n=1 Tax=Mycena albidolilacea TaxID=1033008 RepID=A0AAD7EVJ7_9AGAR|nr:membrane transport protein-domain-containing protein [Mycena albidolilacea]